MASLGRLGTIGHRLEATETEDDGDGEEALSTSLDRLGALLVEHGVEGDDAAAADDDDAAALRASLGGLSALATRLPSAGARWYAA